MQTVEGEGVGEMEITEGAPEADRVRKVARLLVRKEGGEIDPPFQHRQMHQEQRGPRR